MRNMRLNTLAAATLVAGSMLAGSAFAQQKVRIAFIDPLSGPFAPVGQNQLKSWQTVAELANQQKWAPGYEFEVVGFDNKTSPQESLTVLRTAIDQGFRYVAQGNGSSVAIALSDAISKHNERNPGKELVFLNYAAIDPVLTNAQCSFWHFRFDANVEQKMEALTTYMQNRKEIKSVYLINQNYSFGQQVARSAKEMLGRKRPDVKIAGEDLHPLGQVRDFSPYIAKIQQSGADTVITGNWGTDLALLIKAANDAGLKANFYTYYGGTTGVPTAMGASGADRVRMVSYWHPNEATFKGQDVVKRMKDKFKDDYYSMATFSAIRMMADSINASKSADPVKVAFAMAGRKSQSLNGEVEMRAMDHQLQQPLVIATWAKVDGKSVKIDQENTGFGWRTESVQPAFVGVQPSSCQMKRPAQPK
ncbi:MAG TPA: branched-chain amino acid ABC transporter substrate-binding protein [Burkholderiaceae bacterium]|nr:branched-chain amino acid ABC transporter substrate-binding protein [Burkholderiaceae bacterium]